MKLLKRLFVLAMALSIIIVAVYTMGRVTYNGKFLPNTLIDGTVVSSMNYEEADKAYKSDHFNVPVTLTAKSEQFNVTESDMDYSTFSGTEKLISQVDFNDILASIKYGTYYTLAVGDVIPRSADKILKAWGIFDSSKWVKSQNAYVTYDNGWVIVPEVPGTEINLAVAKQAIESILSFNNNNHDLAEFPGFYLEAEIKQDNPELIDFRNRLEAATNKTLTFNFNGSTYSIMPEDVVKQTEYSNDTKSFTIDYETIANNFVDTLAEQVNTLGTTRTFRTTLGDFIDIDGGNWGWVLDEDKTANFIVEQLKSESVVESEGTLYWTQTASENNGADIQNYIEIDLSNQRLYMYKGNEQLVATDITSGNPNHGNNTPGGVYHLTYKTTNTRLKGPTWNVKVKYWMPFNGGIGMHDASWRTDFGGDWYKINGSHGCVNMPTDAAKTVYENIDSSYAIICYWRS